MDEKAPALTHYTVLDLSDESAAFGTRLLAELGLRVIRIEAADGDGLRSRVPFAGDVAGVESSYAHLLYNAGKESVAVDFHSAEGRRVIESVARASDVVVAPLNSPPWLAELLADLEREASGPGIVDVVFRRGMPGLRANDLVATAAGGLLTLNGFGSDPPNYPAARLAYKETGLAACHAALALIGERNAMGRNPGRITISMQEAVALTTLQTSNANIWHWHRRVPTRHTPMSPFTTQKSADGRWLSFTIHPPNWPKYQDWIHRELGIDEILRPEWSDPVFRVQNVQKQAAWTSQLCAKLSREQLIAEGQRRGLLVLPVNSVPDIASEPHLHDRGFFGSVYAPGLEREIAVPRSAFIFDGRRPETKPASSLGADTDRVLAEATSASSRPLATPRPRAVRHQPLAGVRIVDFCWAIAGPLATRLLADLGADVIKVESEYRIDPIRSIGVQPPGEMSWNTNGQFNNSNPNKRAMTLNLNTPEGIDIARRLVETADVVVSNYTPDRMDLWGLGYEQLCALRPGIIVANLAVMGTSGRNKDWRSYGSGIVAMCGLADLTGFDGRDPIGLGTLHTDFTVPYFAASQIMAALLEREKTGNGQFLELSQYEASIHLLDTDLLEYLNDGTVPRRRGNGQRGYTLHGVFPAAGNDRWIAIACETDEELARLLSHTGTTVEGLEAWTSARDRWEAAAELQALGIMASPVEDLEDTLVHDAAFAAGFRELDHPSGVTVLVQEEPITWDGDRLPLKRSPLWGEHTHEVLSGILKLDDAEIAALAEANVLF